MDNSNTDQPPKDKVIIGSSTPNNEDSFTDDDRVDTAGQLKKSKHSHSSCSNDDKNGQQYNAFINHNANVNLGNVFRNDNFLSQQGIASARLSSFQQLEDSIPIAVNNTSSSTTNRSRSSLVTDNRLKVLRSRTKSGRNNYIMNVMNQGSKLEDSSISDQQEAAVGNSALSSERAQRSERRNIDQNETCVRKHIDDNVSDLHNTFDEQPLGSSSSVNSGSIDFSPGLNDEINENINITTTTSNINEYDNHESTTSTHHHGSNAPNSFHQSENNNNMSNSREATHNDAILLGDALEDLRRAEFKLHNISNGIPRFNQEQIACIELAQILDKFDAPKKVFDDIVKWASKHRGNLTNNPPSRATFYGNLESTLSFKKYLPEKVVVHLIGEKASEVTRHDPASSIFSLLKSIILPLGNKRYIFGSRPDLFTPQIGCSSRNDITSSRWFNNTYRKYSHLQKYLNGRVKFMCVPIILFIDETFLDRQGSATICPVSYTLGIFNEATKKNPEAWRHLGFIPKDVVRTVIGNSYEENKRLKLSDFHAHLRAILEPLKEFQTNGPYKWTFRDLQPSGRVNGEPVVIQQEYDLFFPVAYIIGDIKGHNQLTMRYNDHFKSNSISRECNCLRIDGYQSPAQCQHIYYRDIKNLQMSAINGVNTVLAKDAKILLQKKSFHYGNINAFDGIDFGANDYGINFACTPCLLHSWQLRFPDDIFNGFIDKTLGKSETNLSIITFLDACPDIIRSCVRQSDRMHLDISPFSIAIMKDKLYYAKEKHARLFAIYIYAMTTYSYTMTNNMGEHNEFLKLIELSLCLYEYLYQPNFPVHDCEALEENSFQCRANYKIANWKKVYKRVMGIEDEELKFPKWHDLDHFGAYIDFFGSAKHADGGTSESNFIDTAKRPAKRSNKLKTRINQDVATDLTQRRLIKDALNVLLGGQFDNNNLNDQQIRIGTHKNSKSSVFEVQRSNHSAIDVVWKKDNVQPLMSYSAKIKEEIYQLLFSRARGILQGPSTVVKGFTTLDHKGNIFRGHPWFNPALPWYDYVYLNWDEDSDDIHVVTEQEVKRQRLAKIICFLDLSDQDVKEQVINDNHQFKGLCVVVQSILETSIADGYTPTEKANDVMAFRNLEHRGDHLQLVTCWELETKYRILPVSMIADTAFAFQDIIMGEDDKLEHGEVVFEVRKRKDWRDLFNPRDSD
jgi:hypothetical protein|tara:strand:+ start:37 stop:3603 length:3567 start_codon:yes stop_codon:yes gene_type:complete